MGQSRFTAETCKIAMKKWQKKEKSDNLSRNKTVSLGAVDALKAPYFLQNAIFSDTFFNGAF